METGPLYVLEQICVRNDLRSTRAALSSSAPHLAALVERLVEILTAKDKKEACQP
jgi:hypothetical protein